MGTEATSPLHGLKNRGHSSFTASSQLLIIMVLPLLRWIHMTQPSIMSRINTIWQMSFWMSLHSTVQRSCLFRQPSTKWKQEQWQYFRSVQNNNNVCSEYLSLLKADHVADYRCMPTDEGFRVYTACRCSCPHTQQMYTIGLQEQNKESAH